MLSMRKHARRTAARCMTFPATNGTTMLGIMRSEDHPIQSPMNIYEMHAGSWRTYEDGNPYDYRKLAQELVPISSI